MKEVGVAEVIVRESKKKYSQSDTYPLPPPTYLPSLPPAVQTRKWKHKRRRKKENRKGGRKEEEGAAEIMEEGTRRRRKRK